MLDSVYLPIVFIAAFVGVLIAGYALVHRHRSGAVPLAIFALGGSVLAIANAMMLARTGQDAMEFWLAVCLSVVVLVPVGWLLFALQYTGQDRWLSSRYLALILLEPVAFVALVWTNTRHELVWTGGDRVALGDFEAFAPEYALGFWGHQVVVYLYFTLGGLLIARMLFRRRDRERRLATLFIAALSLPVLANLLTIAGLAPTGVDPTGIATILAAGLVATGLFAPELRRVAPVTREIGREAVLADLEDAIVILDDSDRIIDVNPAGARLLAVRPGSCLGRPLTEVHPDLAAAVTVDDPPKTIQLERDGRINHFDIRRSELSKGLGTVTGTVVSLRNVTDRREREQRLDVLNRLLRHDVRNKLNLVRGEIELAGDSVKDSDATRRLDTAIESVDEIVATSNKIGRLSRLLELDQKVSVDIAGELRAHRRIGRLTETAGVVDIDLPETLSVEGGESLVTAFEELVSNGLAHNDSVQPRVTVSLNEDRSDEDQAVIDVRDNGPGIDEQEWRPIVEGRETPLQHTSGVGLWLAHWVVARAGGTLSFDADDGTTVRITLPRSDPADQTDDTAD